MERGGREAHILRSLRMTRTVHGRHKIGGGQMTHFALLDRPQEEKKRGGGKAKKKTSYPKRKMFER